VENGEYARANALATQPGPAVLQKLADTTEKLVQLSEHAKKLTELQHA
jgi:hypothetical protein